MKTLSSLLIITVGLSAAQSAFANGCDSYIDSCSNISGGSNTVCLDSDIDHSDYYPVSCIRILDYADNLVLDCQGHRITQSYGTRINTAIKIDDGAEGVTVRNCEANNWATGLHNEGNYGTIEYNKFFDNRYGIKLYNYDETTSYSYQNEVAFNKLDGNEGGIHIIGNVDGNYLHDNVIHGSEVHGIFCQKFGDYKIPEVNMIDDNQIGQSGESGIYFQDCDGNLITYNTVILNGDHGLWLREDSDSNSVSKNKFNRNGGYGIKQDAGSANTFGEKPEENVCRSNEEGESDPGDYCK